MTLQKLERAQWSVFCDRVSTSLIGKLAEIEIASPELGVQREARSLPVVGLTYDSREDIVFLLFDGFEHMIVHPREMYVEFGMRGLETLGILDEASAWQIVVLRDPMMLPAPGRV